MNLCRNSLDTTHHVMTRPVDGWRFTSAGIDCGGSWMRMCRWNRGDLWQRSMRRRRRGLVNRDSQRRLKPATETHRTAHDNMIQPQKHKTPFSLQVALRCHTPSEHMHIHTCTGSQQSISCSLTTLLFLSSRDPEAESGTLMWILSSGGASFKCFTDGDICLWTAD